MSSINPVNRRCFMHTDMEVTHVRSSATTAQMQSTLIMHTHTRHVHTHMHTPHMHTPHMHVALFPGRSHRQYFIASRMKYGGGRPGRSAMTSRRQLVDTRRAVPNPL